mmetsp:Transcript_6393/g.15457  ORF Transcript_6393/g.15457 Transcript_6393/m.15457 type:complete len:178 (+) Transcript_6393:89-622(+)
MARALCLVFVLLSFSSAAALDGPIDYKAQVDAMKELMEAGTHRSNNDAVAAAPTVSHARVEDDNIDTVLMSTADRIEQDMQERQTMTKRKSLLSSKTKVTEGSAQRFFAKNGMNKVAALLGHKVELQKVDAAAPTKATVSSVQQHASMEDLLAEDEASTGGNWKAVDSLRRSRPQLD